MGERYDRIIRNADVIDGTGAARVAGDIAIRGGRIAQVGRLAADDSAGHEIDARGRCGRRQPRSAARRARRRDARVGLLPAP